MALEAIHIDMEARQPLFLSKGWEDVGEVGCKELHFIEVDEGTEIADIEEKEALDRATFLLGEIAGIGAGLGYLAIFATKYTVGDVFTLQGKANTSEAFCFTLKNNTKSMFVLDRKGEERLQVGLPGKRLRPDCTLRELL